MRKLFRMKYESCTGQCYAYSDVMRIHTLGLDVQGCVEFLKRLLAMHAPSCGNPNIQFRLDVDEFKRPEHYEVSTAMRVDDQRFVASFYRYGSLDLFADDTALGAMNKLIDGALTWYRSAEGRELLASAGVKDRGTICYHGTDEKLVNFALAFSGLNKHEQEIVKVAISAP